MTPLERWHMVARADLARNPKLRSGATARNAKLLLLLLARFQTSRCEPSHESLASESGASVSTVQRILRTLADAGLIEWRRRGDGRPNLYCISYTALAALVGAPDQEPAKANAQDTCAPRANCEDETCAQVGHSCDRSGLSVGGADRSNRGGGSVIAVTEETEQKTECLNPTEHSQRALTEQRHKLRRCAPRDSDRPGERPEDWRGRCRVALMRLGVHPSQARSIVDQVPDSACVRNAIQVLQQQQSSGVVVENPAGFVMRALRDGWTVNR